MLHQAHIHHYVPRWYQRRFLHPGQTQFYYLDMHPETIVRDGKQHKRRSLLKWGPKRCFYQKDLYTTKLHDWTTDQIERLFFGPIDLKGQKAVELYASYSYSDETHEAFKPLLNYMDAQRFRTPRRLDWLKTMIDVKDHNLTLIAMQNLFQLQSTMWTEGVWEIVNAQQSPTKFIVTDEPVTFFNVKAFPGSRDCVYPNDIDLAKVGTRTLFPLGKDSCLIITHVELIRNPKVNPSRPRVNARSYQSAMINLLDIQFGRELEEDEVIRINLILKKRATRYIAAAEEEWLYPEDHNSHKLWSKLDDDWFLFPHLYKVPFTNGTIIGYDEGPAWVVDEFGRKPSDPDYQDKRLRNEQWTTHLRAQQQWARKREGRSVAHIEDYTRSDEVGDKMMQNYLDKLRSHGR